MKGSDASVICLE